jgi:histidinol dehydrogenase
VRIERLDRDRVTQLGGAPGVASEIRSSIPDGSSVAATVSEIIAAVREHGEDAVLRYSGQLDLAGGTPKPLRVSGDELDRAIKRMPLEVVAGLQVTIANVAAVADALVGHGASVKLPQGQEVTVRELAVGAAGIYVPGGRAAYPSTVAMGVVTARAAGVLHVAVCAPPRRDGEIDPMILGACRLCGVDTVYRMGGAQAIAALALGTRSVERVDVIAGPGNLYVQEAKHQLSSEVGIDGFAGPSDLVAVLGRSHGEDNAKLVALDLLAQAEHGAGTLVAVISASERALEAVAAELARVSAAQRLESDGTCALISASDDLESIQIANELAPEHLELMGPEIEALAPKVLNAGCVFVGAGAATAFGDYVAGSNHVLPTAGAARFASALSPRHFRRLMAEVRIGEHAAQKLAAAGAPIARAEGFELHAQSMEARISENPQP